MEREIYLIKRAILRTTDVVALSNLTEALRLLENISRGIKSNMNQLTLTEFECQKIREATL